LLGNDVNNYGRQHSTFDNNRQSKTSYPKKQRPQNLQQKAKGDRAEWGTSISGNDAVEVVVAVSQQCLSTGAFGQYKAAAPSDN